MDRSTYSKEEKADSEATRNDLLALGIDVDSATVDRLALLGTGKTFAVASKAARVLRSRNTLKRKVENITFKHIESQTPSVLSEIFDAGTFHADRHHVADVMCELKNRDSTFIKPQAQPVILKMLEELRVIYLKSPEVFIQTMHGNPKDKLGRVEKAKNLYENRYFDEVKFKEAISRLYPSATEKDSSAFFNLLVVPEVLVANEKLNEKSANVKIRYCDIWEFLALIKQASEDSRRGYDQKNSQLANDVEFWNSKRAKLFHNPQDQLHNFHSEADTQRYTNTRKESLVREFSAILAGENKENGVFSFLENTTMRKSKVNGADDELSTELWMNSEKERMKVLDKSDTVARLLGDAEAKHDKLHYMRGRQVMGALTKAEAASKANILETLSPDKLHVATVSHTKGIHCDFSVDDLVPSKHRKQHDFTRFDAMEQLPCWEREGYGVAEALVMKLSDASASKEGINEIPVAEERVSVHNSFGKFAKDAFDGSGSVAETLNRPKPASSSRNIHIRDKKESNSSGERVGFTKNNTSHNMKRLISDV